MKAMGTDVCIQTCRAEGYVVVFGSTSMKPIDKDKPYRITQSNPELWPNGYLMPRRYQDDCNAPNYFVDDCKSFNDLLDILNCNHKSIAEFADYANCSPELNEPTMGDFLNLAQDLVLYYGNHYFSN
jgi:hypothetical protein